MNEAPLRTGAHSATEHQPPARSPRPHQILAHRHAAARAAATPEPPSLCFQ